MANITVRRWNFVITEKLDACPSCQSKTATKTLWTLPATDRWAERGKTTHWCPKCAYHVDRLAKRDSNGNWLVNSEFNFPTEADATVAPATF